MLYSTDIPFSGNAQLNPVSHQYKGNLGQAIDALNNRYSFVMMNGKHKVFDHKEKIFCELDSVKIFQNQQILHNDKIVNPASMWINDRALRRNFDRVVFKPYSNTKDAVLDRFNTWHGWSSQYVENMSDDDYKLFVKPWLNHINDIFCTGINDQYLYFIKWLAHLVQIPHEKPGVAIMIQSGQGFGKGIFIKLLRKIVGNSYIAQISDSHQVAGGFSGLMRDKLLINFDEATWGGDKKANGRLKALITEENLTVEEKHKNPEDIDHYARFIITSNSDYPVPIDADDRRFFAPDVTKRKPPQSYFDHLGLLLNDKHAVDCFFTYLMNYDLTNFSVRNFPNSETRQRLKAESIIHNDPYKAFILAAYNEELNAVALTSSTITASSLYDSFCAWKDSNSFKNQPVSMTAFGRAMNDAGFTRRKSCGKNVYAVTKADVEKYLINIGIV